ncbi:hypothetical protein EDC96DRAFT_524633 [Choanephora cucurbitarum]|nr:hypothetical protein EDC96DRAFT_524633 [Choanephora cucurbitarum]
MIKEWYAFDIKAFCLFFSVFYLIPYPIYRYLAHYFGWETNPKSVARHWSDLLDGFSYGLIVFTFGNYANTLNWITILAFYPSLVSYALLAELPFAKTSLPCMREWPRKMWILFSLAVMLILSFAAYHLYLASLLPDPFLTYYLSSLLLPFSLFVSSVLLTKEVNSNWCQTQWYRWRYQSSPPEEQRLMYGSRVVLHLHHWQIFYVLAFFTRFDHPISQIGAGITLACYMEGVCAYGYDRLVNDA